MRELVATDLYPELLRYVGMAATLQDANISSATGRDTSVPLVPDQLCQWVTIPQERQRWKASIRSPHT